MIYGRFGHKLTIERKATIDDIKPMTGHKPDKQDRQAIRKQLVLDREVHR
jgi:hypothetical protein